MSSVMRGVVESKTKNFVALAALKLRTQAQVEACLVAGSYTQVGSLYLINTPVNFKAFLTNLTTGSVNIGTIDVAQYQPLLDMGKELRFGLVGAESSVLTLRQVKTSSASNLDDEAVGFVVTDNKATDNFLVNNANVLCRVARV